MSTIADLIASSADVIWRCEVCQRIRPVDLERIAREKGPETTLANRRPRCRLCPGRVQFEVRRGPFTHPLDTIKPGSEADGVYTEGERSRLKAMGWRLELGKWVAPI